uniref:Xaa-Pro aminopeptidase n=1 Tax=Ningiella ruwaisensis TaxID=2364274 RepID=UPI0010A06707|nr:Xaa-Pro aminopeptidase [Ningiella ruwaisensis]
MITKSEFQARRKSLLSQCDASSIIIVPAASLQTRSNDTEYPFRQDSDFWYLTGFNEPDALLILSNQLELNETEASATLMFVLPKDPHAEVWHGRRLGVEAAPKALGIDQAHSIDTLDELLPELINGHEHLYYTLDKYPHVDSAVQKALARCKNAPKQSMVAPRSIIDVAPMLHDMRRIKSESELELMRKAAQISADAHKRAMSVTRPDMYEYQLEAELHHEFLMQGARSPAYGTIVGSGENACILHYTQNESQIQDGDLILIDAGAEFQSYAGDITRTFPANGQFTPPQRSLYQLVLDAQLAALAVLKPGATIGEAMQAAVKIIVTGLVDLKILNGKVNELIEQEAWRPYFMHGLGHYLGLDVHDVGRYKHKNMDIPLEPGVVITVEPGLYISADSDAPKQFRGIGIRIEDDVIITENGIEIMTNGVPKTIDEIEALVGSALDDKSAQLQKMQVRGPKDRI